MMLPLISMFINLVTYFIIISKPKILKGPKVQLTFIFNAASLH